MSDQITVEVKAGVQTLRFSRPEKKNALNRAMYSALAEALAAGERSSDVRVHLFAAEGTVFTAGNDLKDFLERKDSLASGAPAVAFLEALVTAEKPLVAAVDGLAVGIGTTLLLHCDLVYATPASLFRTPFVDLGLVPEAASSLLLPQRAGHARAFELLCLGVTFDAARAEQAGIVNAVVHAADLETRALSAARELAAKPQAALLQARRLMRGAPGPTLERMRQELAVFNERLASPEAQQALRSFFDTHVADHSWARQG